MSNTNEQNKEAELFAAMAHKISADIFKNGLLLSYTIGFWDGKIKQNDDDVIVQKADSAPEVYEKGTKLLLPSGSLKAFYGYRSRLGLYLSQMSFGVPGLRGSRFIPKSVYADVKAHLEEEQAGFYECVEKFMVKYPDYRRAQIETFNAKYPLSAGKMDDLYPAPEYVRNRFCYHWMPYAWDYASILEVESNAKDILAQRAMGIVNDACISMREQIHEELTSAIKVVKSAKHKVNIRTITSLQEKINSLKSINIFGDKKLEELLNRSAQVIGSVSSWQTEDLQKTDFDVQLGALLKDVGASITSAIEDPAEEISVFREAISCSTEEPDEADEIEMVVSRKQKRIEI
jgi:hypothetical protein